MSLRCIPSLRTRRAARRTCGRTARERLADDLPGEIGAAGREQCGEQECAPEDQGGQPQGGIGAQPARGGLKQGPAQVAKIKTRGAVNQVVSAADQGVEIGDGLAGQIMVLGEHQVGAGRSVELAQPQHLLGRRVGAGLDRTSGRSAGRARARTIRAARAARQPSSRNHLIRPRRPGDRRRTARHRPRPCRRVQTALGGAWPAARPSRRGGRAEPAAHLDIVREHARQIRADGDPAGQPGKERVDSGSLIRVNPRLDRRSSITTIVPAARSPRR